MFGRRLAGTFEQKNSHRKSFIETEISALRSQCLSGSMKSNGVCSFSGSHGCLIELSPQQTARWGELGELCVKPPGRKNTETDQDKLVCSPNTVQSTLLNALLTNQKQAVMCVRWIELNKLIQLSWWHQLDIELRSKTLQGCNSSKRTFELASWFNLRSMSLSQKVFFWKANDPQIR